MKDPGGKVCKETAHNALEYNQIHGFRVLLIIGCCVLWYSGEVEDSKNTPTRKSGRIFVGGLGGVMQ
jgi:hypothetical protein